MGNASSSSSSSSAKRQAERHAREERKREFAEQQEREERARAEREEVLARIRSLLDENNAFDPLTDDDRAALARHCRRVVAMPGERVMHWRPKRERRALRMRREAAEAERELERERRGMAPMRDEDHEFDPDAALYVVAEGAVDVVAYRDDADDDADDDDGEGDGVHGAVERAARDPPATGAGEVAVTLRRGACFGELEKIFGASPTLRAAVVAVDPNDPTRPGAVLWAVDGRVLRRKKAFKAMVESMRAQVAAWRPLLDGVAFFADGALSPMQRSFLACALRATRFRPREAVAKEGDECAGAWMVMEGEAHAMATLVGGDERWVAGYWPGDGFGFNSLVWGHPHPDPGGADPGGCRASRTVPGVRGDDEMRRGRRRDGARVRRAGDVRAHVRKVDALVASNASDGARVRGASRGDARIEAARADASGGSEHREDDRGDGGGGDGQSRRRRRGRRRRRRRRLAAPSHAPHAQPAAGPFASPPPLVERQSADPTRGMASRTGRHMPDELLYPEEFETESEGEEGEGVVGERDENAGENRGDETPRERRALRGASGSGRDARSIEDESRRRRRRDGKGSGLGLGVTARIDANRPVRRREPLGPGPRGPTRLARLVAALESHSLFEGAERRGVVRGGEGHGIARRSPRVDPSTNTAPRAITCTSSRRARST